ncbi:hypothetical protein GCM10009836_23810 [Pseudonocardia ailaonensis]|uniref:Allophanate hydrolase C-terminal domain-containing protein n=1 Tax=Pseudonocardia ailaonensis TaxID=367279 RepID=A0ABN2MYD5_9PSEU
MTVLLGVVAAHRRGQPLHEELLALGAVFARTDRTAAVYRLLALDGGGVPRGGLVRVTAGGASVEVELYRMPVPAVGRLVVSLPAPLAVGSLVLDSGRSAYGIVCESWVTATARDVTEHGSWPAYLAAVP